MKPILARLSFLRPTAWNPEKLQREDGKFIATMTGKEKAPPKRSLEFQEQVFDYSAIAISLSSSDSAGAASATG